MDGPLNDFVKAFVHRPADFYMDVHIERLPDGSSRGQFGEVPQPPLIDAVVSANLDPASKVAAPGGLISIFARNLAKVDSTIDGWKGMTLPDTMNGVTVGIGSLRPRPILVSPSQITVLMPMETPSGTLQLAVNNGAALSQPFSLQVLAAAPAAFAYPMLKFADFSPVSAMNPAQTGDEVLVSVTGLGQKALFYRTLNRAQVGDVFVSLIHTCQLCKANSFEYLIELMGMRRDQWIGGITFQEADLLKAILNGSPSCSA